MGATDADVTASDLRSDARTAAGNLLRAELGLLRKEFQDEIQALRVSALAFGAAGILGLFGAQALVETAVTSSTIRPWRGLLVGFGLLSAAGLAARTGYRALPQRALRRVSGDPQPGMQVFE